MTCIVNNATVDVTWIKDGDSVRESARIDTKLNETTSYLRIPKVVEEDSGNYSCEARSKSGILAHSAVMIKVERKLASLLFSSFTIESHLILMVRALF